MVDYKENKIMGISFKQQTTKADVNITHPAFKRSSPTLRWIAILLIIAIPFIYLLYRLADIYIFVTFPGYITFEKIIVRAPANGYIKKLNIKLADSVIRNQILLTFASPEVEVKLQYLEREKEYLNNLAKSLRSNENLFIEQQIALANTNIKDSYDLYQRFNSYKNKGIIDDLQLEQVRVAWINAQHSKIQFQSLLVKNQADLNHQTEVYYRRKIAEINNDIQLNQSLKAHFDIRAVASASVIAIDTYETEFVSPGQPLITLATNQNPYVVAFIEPKYFNQLYKDKKVKVILPNNKQITGSIYKTPIFSDRLPADQVNPIATRSNKIIILIRLENDELTKEYVYGLPVQVKL